MQAVAARWWLGLVGLALALAAAAAQAAPQCDGGRCSAGLEAAQIARIERTQERSNWCWAASVSMVLAHHGLQVSQEEVARRHFGQPWDLSVPTSGLTRVLGFAWRDAGGRDALPVVAVRDRLTGQMQLSDQGVIEELAMQRPLILATASHAVVLVRVEYERSPATGRLQITGGTVIDPAPGRGMRSLARAELEPAYLAAVQLASPLRVAGLPAASAN